MKKMLSVIVCSALLASLASCSESTEDLKAKKDDNITTAQNVQVTSEALTESDEDSLIEIPVYSKDLNSKVSFDEFSMYISKEWEKDYDEDNNTVYYISPNSALTIKCSSTHAKIDSEADIPTNEDYIKYKKINNSKLSTYQTNLSILFLCNKNDEGSYYEYQFYNNDKVYNLTFRAYSHHYFSQDSIDNVLDSISLLESQNTTEKTTDKPTEPPTTKPNISKSQEKALKSAQSYIKLSGFSRDELIEQLEYEQFSHEDAVYGADNCGADWNAEALESAKSYINMSGFSYTGLIEQLEYEQFTSDQARYGADNCGADWNQQAADSAASYLKTFDFSRDELIEQLLYEGFTQEQAEYGASANGY